MKRVIILIATLLLDAMTFISFAKAKNTPIPDDYEPKQDKYETMWKKFEEHLKNSLPESADKVLESIEQKALNEKNQVQLLKAYLFKQKVMVETGVLPLCHGQVRPTRRSASSHLA